MPENLHTPNIRYNGWAAAIYPPGGFIKHFLRIERQSMSLTNFAYKEPSGLLLLTLVIDCLAVAQDRSCRS